MVCLLIDPIVFRSGISAPLLPEFRTFAYIATPLSGMLLLLWLSIKRLPRFLIALLTGVFVASSIVSCYIGIRILPMTLLGLIFIVGILGFLPFLTSLIYFRSTIRTFHSLRGHMPIHQLGVAALIGSFCITGPAAAFQWSILRANPDYEHIPPYFQSTAITTTAWYSINSGEGLEKQTTFETTDTPDRVFAYYRTLLEPLHWEESSSCNRDIICFSYQSATDQSYHLSIQTQQIHENRYYVTITLQK